MPYEVEFRQSAEFKFDGARKRLLDLQQDLSGEDRMIFVTSADNGLREANDSPQHLHCFARNEEYLSISASIDFESRSSVGCAGAILAYISRHRSAQRMPADEGAYSTHIVSRVEMFRLDKFM